MTDEWIWLGLRCLRENKNYRAYCEAKSKGDTAAIADLEQKHISIARVYEDFGDVYFPLLASSKKGFSKQWHTWLDTVPA